MKPLEVIKMIIPTIVPTVFVYMVTGNQLWLNSIFYLKTVDQIHIMDILQRVVISGNLVLLLIMSRWYNQSCLSNDQNAYFYHSYSFSIISCRNH